MAFTAQLAVGGHVPLPIPAIQKGRCFWNTLYMHVCIGEINNEQIVLWCISIQRNAVPMTPLKQEENRHVDDFTASALLE